MADETQSLCEIIIKIAQTPCVTLKSATASLGWLLSFCLAFFGWWLVSFLIFPSYALSFLLYLILIRISHFTIKLIGHAAAELHPYIPKKGYKDTQGLSQQTSSGRSPSTGDAFGRMEGWKGVEELIVIVCIWRFDDCAREAHEASLIYANIYSVQGWRQFNWFRDIYYFVGCILNIQFCPNLAYKMPNFMPAALSL